jgi:Ca-activated chloride channel family protein
MLWLFLILPVLIGIYLLLQRRRRKYALRYASLSMVKEALGRGPGFRRHIPPLLFLLAVAVMIFSLARPAAMVTLPEQQGTIILTIDISGSMRAGDIAPSRLEAAKSAARAFVAKQPRNVRIGVVAFSATSALVQAPSKDQEEVLSAINRLSTQRGTAIGSGILTSLNAIFENREKADEPAPSLYESLQPPEPELGSVTPGAYSSAVVVLLSDGQSNQGPNPMEVAGQAALHGVRIFTVGVGSPEGAVLNFWGRSIRVQLDEAELKGIAATTYGTYFKAESETDLVQIYEALSTQLVMEREKTELTAIFTAIAAVVLLVAGYLSLLWLNRLP